MIKRPLRGGSVFLMWALVAVILAAPLADTHRYFGGFLAVVLLLSVLIGANLEGNNQIVVLASLPLGICWSVARLLEAFGSKPVLYDHVSHILGLLLSCTILGALFDRVRRASEITSHVIAEAVMIYLIIAIAFSQIYWIFNGFEPHSFTQVLPESQGSTLLYFSMVTLTGLGGVIQPVNPFLRLISAFESMTGLFYIAVVVSRLVSSYMPGAASRKEQG